MALIICKECGAQVSEFALNCPSCGSPISRSTQNQQQTQQQAQQPYQPYQQQNTGYQNQAPQGLPPKTWLVESILVTVMCCLPFGIAGIVNATKVESLWYAGQPEAAMRASQEAGKWTKIGFWIGVSVIALYILFYVVMIIIGVSAAGFHTLNN